MTAPRRRWSFTLRTLFVAVTAFGCWLGWQMNLVHRRAATRAACERLGGPFIDEDYGGEDSRDFPRVSFLRYWLGDRAVWGALLPDDAPDALRQRLVDDFPEIPHELRGF